jgi:AcrR family transcriptional regulator
VAPVDTRDRLVDVSRAHLDEHGLDGLSLRAVARRAGVSHGAPLRHFPSLAALCSAVAAQGFRDLHAGVEAAMDAAGPDAHAGDRLRAAGRGYVAFALANPGVFGLMWRPERLDRDVPELQEAGNAAFSQLLEAVAAAQALGWRPDEHPSHLAVAVWSTMHGLATLALQGILVESVQASGGIADLPYLVNLTQDLVEGLP